MTQTIEVPLWVLILILLFAAVTFASHFLFPSVRWFFRRRMERVVAKVNKRLRRPIAPFKLARRHDMIQRLIYDNRVHEAIVQHARARDEPESVAFETARVYAREIVPSFSATAYFTFGTRVAKWLSRSMYRVRLSDADREMLEALDPDAAVVFVMNHRSNMDYVLVTYLAARASALSYAVGEWARIWPLSVMIRAMGAYFIRRGASGILYRRVLTRYVQMATAGGVTQAVFPEGGLSLDGAMARPRLGILADIVSGHAPGGPEVIFVPVALNYDRVLEDRFLVAADKAGVRKFRPPLKTVLGGLLWHMGQRITGRFKGFGTAAVSFGAPLSLAGVMAQGHEDPTAVVGAEVAARIAAAIPVLPVPLVAHVLLAQGAMDRGALCVAVDAALGELSSRGVPLPRRDATRLTEDALALLKARGLLAEDTGRIVPQPDSGDLLRYYARSIAHHFPPAAATGEQPARRADAP